MADPWQIHGRSMADPWQTLKPYPAPSFDEIILHTRTFIHVRSLEGAVGRRVDPGARRYQESSEWKQNMSPRTAHRLAWLGAGISGCLAVGGLLLSLLAFAASNGKVHLAPHQVFNPLITLSFSTVGALVASRHPRNPIGWILCATGFFSALDLLALGYSQYSESVTTDNSLL